MARAYMQCLLPVGFVINVTRKTMSAVLELREDATDMCVTQQTCAILVCSLYCTLDCKSVSCAQGAEMPVINNMKLVGRYLYH